MVLEIECMVYMCCCMVIWSGMKMMNWRMCKMEVKKWRMKIVIIIIMLILANRICKIMHILIHCVSIMVDVLIIFLSISIFLEYSSWPDFVDFSWLIASPIYLKTLDETILWFLYFSLFFRFLLLEH